MLLFLGLEYRDASPILLFHVVIGISIPKSDEWTDGQTLIIEKLCF